MPPTAFHHRHLPLLLLQAREALIARFRPLFIEHGVTEQQWRIIRALSDEGPMEQGRLSDFCRLSGPSIGGVLGRMEQQGLVQRRRLESDQRRVMISLTPRSRALVRKMAPLVEATYDAIEREIGIGLMREVADRVDGLLMQLATTDAGQHE